MECTRGVYCVDIEINAKAISMRTKIRRIHKKFTSVPMALDDDLNPVKKDFIKRFIDSKVMNMYDVNYSITNKKYLSGLCYDI